VNIAFDAKRLFFNRRGLGFYARTVLINLIRFFPQHEYFLFSPKPGKTLPELTDFPMDHPHLHAVFPSGPEQWVHSIWRSWGITKPLGRLEANLFHGLSNELPFNIRNFSGKKIVTIHDLLYLRLARAYPWVDRKIYHLKFKKAARSADRIVAVSKQTQHDIQRFLNIPPEKISVVYQTCHPHFQASLDPEYLKQIEQRYRLPKDFILYNGALEPKKNIGLMLKAWAQLGASLRPAMVLVGRGSRHDVMRLRQTAQKNKMGAAFQIIDDVDHIKDLAAIFQLARGFVFPSFFEGFGIPIIQAQFCRTPVLASKAAGLEEAGGEHSLYFDPKSSESLAHGIERVLNDETLREEMVLAGAEYVQKFSAKRVTQDLMNVYTEVLARS
jgi:glycosyltransferase involved in cell wall biosynthesis